MKELIILTEHFSRNSGATAQLLSDLVESLTLQGHQVTVLTSGRSHNNASFQTVRFSLPYLPETSILVKSLKGIYFCLCSFFWLLCFSNTNQRLLVVSNPPFIVIVGLVLRLVKGTKYYFLFQDIFPRSASLTGILPAAGPILAAWRYLIKSALRNSQCVILLSPAMQDCCRREFGYGYRIEVIPNWSVIDPPTHSYPKVNNFSTKYNPTGCFVVQYSGNFGRLHDMLTILEAARLLQSSNILFQFIGGGAKYSHILAYKKKFELSNVIVLPYQPRNTLAQVLPSSDIGLVSLMPGAEDTVAPSKILGILAMHRPVLLIANQDSALANEIVASKSGRTCSPGDPLNLAETIQELSANPILLAEMSRHANLHYVKHYRKDLAVKAYARLLFEE